MGTPALNQEDTGTAMAALCEDRPQVKRYVRGSIRAGLPEQQQNARRYTLSISLTLYRQVDSTKSSLSYDSWSHTPL